MPKITSISIERSRRYELSYSQLFSDCRTQKNITKAAEVLHITQPTLSRQLMQLEEDLGTKLFDRSQHKFALTPSGQFLVQRAQEILDMVEKTTLDIQDQEQNLSGSIAFGAGEYYATQTLAQLIGAFQR